MLIAIIVFVMLIFFLVIPLAFAVTLSQRKAKRDAEAILKVGIIKNPKKVKSILNTLSHIRNDMEASDLWKRLNDLRLKSSS